MRLVSYKPHLCMFLIVGKPLKEGFFYDIREGRQSDIAKLSSVWQPMANMGLDFASPSKNDKKAWEHIQKLYQVGITFHSCGCSGPGYIPRDRDALLAYFKGIREGYEEQLKFFRSRTEPASKAEIQRDNDKNFYYICRIPSKLKSKNGFVKNEDAIDFWIGKIKEVEEEIAKI